MTTTTRRPEKPRWVWIPDADGGRVLAFVYIDKVAGPSAKGAAVGTPPTAEQVQRAVDEPDRTFRQPSNFRAMPLRAEEVLRLGLPKTPPWIGHFDGSPVPPPRGEPSREITGTVTQDARPVAGARVRLGLLSGPERELLHLDQGRSDAAGRFQFSLAPMSEVAVIADIVGASSSLIVVPADRSSATLELRRTASITGEIRRADVLCAGHVSIVGLDGGVHRVVTTKPAGHYRIDDVVPGTYAMQVAALDADHHPNGPTVVAHVTVDEGGVARRDFMLAVGVVIDVAVLLEHTDDGGGGDVYLVTGALAPRLASELRPLHRTPALRSARSMQIKGRRMTTQFCDVTPGEYTLCVVPRGYFRPYANDQPVASLRIIVEYEPQAVEIALPALVR